MEGYREGKRKEACLQFLPGLHSEGLRPLQCLFIEMPQYRGRHIKCLVLLIQNPKNEHASLNLYKVAVKVLLCSANSFLSLVLISCIYTRAVMFLIVKSIESFTVRLKLHRQKSNSLL